MSRELREEARRREEEKERLRRRREEFSRDLGSLAALPEGRRFFRWLIDQGNLFAEDWMPGPEGAYQSGKKATALRLWRLLEETLPPALFLPIVMKDVDPQSFNASASLRHCNERENELAKEDEYA